MLETFYQSSCLSSDTFEILAPRPMTRVIGARASINGLSLAHSWYLLNKHGDLSLLMYFSKQALVRIKASWKYCSITFFLGIHLKQEVWARRDKQVARGVVLGREKMPCQLITESVCFPISSLVTRISAFVRLIKWFLCSVQDAQCNTEELP